MMTQDFLPRVASREPAAAQCDAQRSNRALPRLHLTYAITPPNQTTPLERRRAIAETQSARIAALPIDALLIYDLQDETSRTSAPRPFPFIPKVDALSYALDELDVGELPLLVYRAVADQHIGSLEQWLKRLAQRRCLPVFVGAPSRHRSSTLTLPEAYSACRSHVPHLPFGSVLIAERHQTSGDEDLRVWAKVERGCRFFVSQTMWSAEATKGLLEDLEHRAALADQPLPRIVLTISPCGSEQTLRFQEWLGVNVPAHIQHELLQAKDMLARSIDLAHDLFVEVSTFAKRRGITVGCNVESVSTRASEVEASIELTRRIADYQSSVRLSHLSP